MVATGKFRFRVSSFPAIYNDKLVAFFILFKFLNFQKASIKIYREISVRFKGDTNWRFSMKDFPEPAICYSLETIKSFKELICYSGTFCNKKRILTKEKKILVILFGYKSG